MATDCQCYGTMGDVPEETTTAAAPPHPERTPFRAWPVAGRWAVYVSAGLVLLLTLATVLAVAGVRRTFPTTDGTLEVAGLNSEVTVRRDDHGIPQVYADDSDDLFFAQGFVQAQDRFREMDVRRHITAGRLSELVGSGGLEADKVTRVLGWRQVAAHEYGLLSSESRNALAAFSAGVNAYLQQTGSTQLSLENLLLAAGGADYEPERWTPVDSLAWLKAMAWDLRGNMQDEVTRSRLSVNFSAEQIAELFPAYPYAEHAPILPGFGASTSAKPQRARTNSGTGIGSNSWVVSGRFTATGKPLLANDPHLDASLPGVWYQMGLHCRTVGPACPYDVSGFTLAGVPGVVIGHNQDISWGFTNLDPDVSDLFLEKVRGHDYYRNGRWLPLREHDEQIKIKGEEPKKISVRSTPHGPLLSDVSRELSTVGANADVPAGSPDRGNGYAVALAWTALQPSRTADAIFMLNRATDWPQFRAAASRFAVPSQNLVYADTTGNIGYQAPGAVPIRRAANTGDYPAPGWDPRYDWTGRTIPFEQMPWVKNPAEGFVVTANQAVTGPGYRQHLTSAFDRGYRSQRIRDLLEAQIRSGHKLTVADMAHLQLDSRNPIAPVLVPQLLRLHLPTKYLRSGQRLLRGWDFQQPADSAPAAYFNVVWRNLLARTFHDQLPQSLWPDGGQRWMGVVEQLLQQPHSRWWDDVTTDDVRETRDDVLRQSMVDARYELTRRLALDPRKWQWGRLHELELDNQTLGQSGIGPVEALLNRGPWRIGGGSSAVDASSWDASATGEDAYTATSVPSMRMVVDLADLDRSRWINLTGASGHAFNRNYTDQTDLWADGKTLPWAFSADAVDGSDTHTLQLRPGN